MDAAWLALAGAGALFLAWIDGANNAANSVGAPIGSGAMRAKQAIALAAAFELLGGLLYGQFVSVTLMRGIVKPEAVGPRELAVGMTFALLTSGAFVYAATRAKIPVSVTQSVVGGIVGFGLAVGGVGAIDWARLAWVVSAWLLVPLAAMALAFAEYKLFSRLGGAVGKRALLVGGLLFFATSSLATTLYAYSPGAPGGVAAGLAAAGALSAGYIAFVKRGLPRDELEARSYIYRTLLAASSAAMAFSHGANDVSNPSGPLAGVMYSVLEGETPRGRVAVPFPVIAFSAIGLAAGILTWGYSVVETIGERITVLSLESAFVAQFAASQLTLIAVWLGLPTTTTGAIVGSVAGVGLARGVMSVNARLVAKITLTWFAGVAVTALATFLLTYTTLSI